MALVIPTLPMTGSRLKTSLEEIRQRIPLRLSGVDELTSLGHFVEGDRCITPEGSYEVVSGLGATPGSTVIDMTQNGFQALLSPDSPVVDAMAVLADTRPSAFLSEGCCLTTEQDGHAYRVAAPGASNHHLTTAGGVKLYALPSQRSFDPRAFGAVADGTTDDTAAMAGALAAAQEASSEARTMLLSGGSYGFSEPLRVTASDLVIRFERSARLLPLAKETGIRVEGSAPSSWTMLAADAAEGSTTITLPAAPGWAIGSWVEIRSDRLLPGNNTEGGLCCVIGRITKVNGATITLDRPMPYDFTTAENASAGQPQMIQNVVIDAAQINRPDYSAEIAWGIYLKYCADVTVIAPKIYGSKPQNANDQSAGVSGININHGCINVSVTDPRIAHIGWYGIGIAGYAENILVEGGLIYDCRHAISLVWLTNGYGEPHNVRIAKVTGRDCNLAIFDTHDTGRGVVFDSCKAFGSRGDSGFQIRNMGTLLRGCESAYNVFDGIVGRIYPDGMRIEDPMIYRNGRSGVVSIAPISITGGSIVDNAQDGSGYAFSLPGGMVRGTRLRGKLTGSGANTVGYFSEAVAPAVNASLVLSGVDAVATNSGQWFVQKVSTRYCQDITISDSDMRGYGDNLVRGGMNSGELGPRRSNTITISNVANRCGRVTLTGSSTTVTNPDVLRRYTDPLWASNIRITRMVSGSADGVLSIGRITSGSHFTILSTSASDNSVVEWEITG